ncbi:Wadjet anti-phage system protein JetD domain-containing protein [[Clostridium] polysaccharolyticum]|uniref:Wadjet protein JetD C-terminal domain-containing protein n=1 Tax=[Clostridium] polysaccharolyticum TaxID=29364 RepID=A0A1I0F880_9FIRM|nr:Wadjet anti-phage system protein JetD domain-containing protein [[Clostridium] polysaccharolyticum]SET53483.1 hypothetical protein SAMN04487772_12823 [[Clostridium] polysaccharolyticum]
MSKTLAQYLIERYAEGNNKSACDWRAGCNDGVKHPEIDQSVINEIGKQSLIEQAKELEKQKLIKPDWNSFHTDIKKIDFPMSSLDKLYKIVKCPNPRQILREQILFITELKEKTEKSWLVQYYTDILEKLQKGKFVQNADDRLFLKCLYHIAQLKDYTWKRFFSEDVFHDSKLFEKKYEKRVLTVLKKNPNILEGMHDYEILAEYGILTYSQTLAWKGNLVYSIEGNIIDSSSMIYGNIINAQTLVHSVPVSLKGVKKIITIENQANYEDMNYNAENLYIFIHGFPSPKARKFLKHLTAIADKDTPYYHWGDMDLGGIRIFQYLKKELFQKLVPMKMDVKTYIEALQAGYGIPFDEEKRKKYIELDAGELTQLKSCILQHGMDIEQEGVRA